MATALITGSYGGLGKCFVKLHASAGDAVTIEAGDEPIEILFMCSEILAAITTRHQLDGLQGMYTKIISIMMEKGLFREDDPALLATEVTAPVVLLISKADRQPQYEKEIMENIEKHIRHFCDVYMRG